VVGFLLYSLLRLLLDVLATKPWWPGQPAGRSAGPTASGPDSGEADQAGALETRRSDGRGGVARTHSEIGLGGRAGETGDRLSPFSTPTAWTGCGWLTSVTGCHPPPIRGPLQRGASAPQPRPPPASFLRRSQCRSWWPDQEKPPSRRADQWLSRRAGGSV